MKALSPEISALLDKLYNLRSDDSMILVEMEKQKNKAEETKARTTAEKKELQEKIAELEQLNESLNDQGDKLTTLLSRINREDYAIVLDRLKIDFDPQNLVEKINKSLPRTIDTITNDTKKAAEKLLRVEEEMNNAITTIEEIGIRKDSALANQDKLNEYFELALSGHINITRDSITNLLSQFGFGDEEQREAAKILMFPEDALLSYDARIREKEKSGKSIIDVIAEAKSAEPVDEVQEKEDEVILEENTLLFVEDNVEVEPAEFVYDDPEAENKAKDKLMKLFEELEIGYLDFSAQELEMLMENCDEKTIRNNIKYIGEIGIEKDIFINHAALLVDSELQDKIKMLLDIGKEIVDVYLNPTILEKYSKNELKEAIQTLQDNGMDPKNVPLMAF